MNTVVDFKDLDDETFGFKVFREIKNSVPLKKNMSYSEIEKYFQDVDVYCKKYLNTLLTEGCAFQHDILYIDGLNISWGFSPIGEPSPRGF